MHSGNAVTEFPSITISTALVGQSKGAFGVNWMHELLVSQLKANRLLEFSFATYAEFIFGALVGLIWRNGNSWSDHLVDSSPENNSIVELIKLYGFHFLSISPCMFSQVCWWMAEEEKARFRCLGEYLGRLGGRGLERRCKCELTHWWWSPLVTTKCFSVF